MITIEKPKLEVVKEYEFTNVSGRNKTAARKVKKAITAYQMMVNREAYYAANFIPR